MPLYEDKRVCTKCGRVGKDGKLPTPFGQVAKEKNGPEIENLRVRSRLHDDENWYGLPEEVRNAVPESKPFVFPDLEAICISTLRDIVAGRLPASQTYPYAANILSHGGIQPVALEITSCILPEIRALQGRTVDRGNLDKIWVAQANQGPWHTASSDMGYIDFVTDDRDDKYFRLYHGQAKCASRRILREHNQAIFSSANDTLHYYILWVGNGHRVANFLKAWALPREHRETHGKDWSDMMMTFLEYVIIRAFRAHHGLLYYGESDDSPLGFGLNVMSPLVQGRAVSDVLRADFKGPLLHSPDLQIAFWPKFRSSQTASANGLGRSAPRPLFRLDFSAALSKAVNNDELYQLLLDAFTADLALPRPTINDIPFFGNLGAKIGFLLDIVRISPVVDGCPAESSEDDLPWALKGCQFKKDNVLVWTFDFKKLSGLGSENCAEVDEPRNTELLAKHSALVGASHAKVILVCGPRAENIVRHLPRVSRQKDLELRGFKYPLYVMDTGPLAKRLFVRCPKIPADRRSMMNTMACRLCEALRFAISIVDIRDIRPYFLESSSILGHILSIAKNEKAGTAAPLTTSTLDGALKVWLARKGFEKEEDIRRLEQLAGSLSAGLLILLHTLPRRQGDTAANPDRATTNLKRKRTESQPFGNVYEPTRDFISGILAQREAKYHEVLKSLADSPGPKSDSIDMEIAGLSGSETEFGTAVDSDMYEPLADALSFEDFKVLRGLTHTASGRFVGDGLLPSKKKPDHKPVGWWSNFREEEYHYELRPTEPLSGPSILDCRIVIPTEVMSGCDEVFVKIEIVAEGCSHENMLLKLNSAPSEATFARLAQSVERETVSTDHKIRSLQQPN
ncbi:uncharacterized protein E0L32_012331 [Thyridium curvatum]|uniref:Uncharacterized protein n=1 Tax=Thyridium curvatum TaxID=1093900 RepID=A0A507BJ06_9PEZI|nr:uncharacterized protein E0L32_012331 [Thyridium curvatum]TPX17021.1 hypothetical protein E0L32_012331 [Thyridium curvatum]